MIKKINTFFLIGMILSMMISSVFLYWKINDIKDERITTANNDVVNVISKTFRDKLDSIEILMKSIAITVDIEKNNELLEKLKLTNKENDAVIGLFFANLKGDVFSDNLNGWVPGFNAREVGREWFNSIAIDEMNSNISDPYMSEENGESVVTVSVPIYKNNEIIGILGADISLSLLMVDLNLEYAITDSKGIVIVADETTEGWLYKNIYKVRPEFESVTNLPYLYDTPDNDIYTVSKTAIGKNYQLFSFT